MMQILKIFFIILLLFIEFGAARLPQLCAQQFNFQDYLNIISADSIRKHVEFLGHDSLEGRGTGTRGEQIAAHYIASHLKQYKIKPIGDQNTYFQSIPMHGSYPLRESQLKLSHDNNEFFFKLFQDYLLYKSGAQTFIPQPVPLVFAGYGIIAPEYDYNDYQSLDVDGKVVVFLSGEPLSNDSTYFNGSHPTIYSYPESKQRIAISRGALGSIMIPASRQIEFNDWSRLENEFAGEDVTLAYSVTSNLSVLINPEAGRRLFTSSPYSLDDINEMDATGMVRSFEMAAQISFKGVFQERDFFAANVIGLFESKPRKPDDSYFIISAHYDHLGIGMPVNGDSIYNGVLDNAIGVAAALEIARIFSLLQARTYHSIVFLFLTGEEKGLLGSTYYIDHPIVPLHKTIANLNIDGLAVNDRFNDIIGIGAQFSTLENFLKNTAAKMGLAVSPVPSRFLSLESFSRSDQISFAKAGIPSILISEGLNYQSMSSQNALQLVIDWYDNIYHTPFDDLNQPINYQAARQHCQVLFTFCFDVANSKTVPQWKPGTPFIVERLRSIAEKR